MATENIDIGISARLAKAGAARVRRALDSIIRKSREMARKSKKDSKGMAAGYKKIAGAAVALAAVFAAKAIVKRTIDFGQAIANLSAITGATGKDLDFLREKSLAFGAATTLTASEAAEAFKIIASAKPDLLENVEALSQVTEAAIVLAEATGETLPVAANTMASALNQFGQGADQAVRFINVLAAGSKRGAAEVGDMAEALKQSGIIAAQAGLNFEETNAALQLLSTVSLKGSRAGNQFRGVLLGLAAAGRDEFNPEVVGMEKALDNLAGASLTTQDKLKLFGRENLAAANTLIEGRDALKKLTVQLTGSDIAFEQQAIRIDTLSGDIKTLKSAYEGLELTIGAELNGALRSMTQAATESIRALSKNPLLQAGVRKTLDFIHRVLQDIALAWDQITGAVKRNITGTAEFQGVWQEAIENVINWTKILWKQFVIGGPANLKLGITLMIAAWDRLGIFLTEKTKTFTVLMLSSFTIFGVTVMEKMGLIAPAVERVFILMKNAIKRTFDNILINIGSAIDNMVGFIQQKIFSAARLMANMGFEDRAQELTDMGIAMGKFAGNADAATKAAAVGEAARQAELKVIDDVIQAIKDDAETRRGLARDSADILIKEYEDTATAAVLASQAAVQGAIDERDATLLAIEALRTKRSVINDGDASGAEGSEPPLATVDTTGIDVASDAYDALGDKAKLVVDGMADGFADMASGNKNAIADMAASIIQDLIRIAIQAQITKALSAFLGGFSAGGTATVPALKAAHGLNFEVGGGGGTDSKLVQFMATPGETVEVKTPQQQKAGGNGGGNVTIVMNNTINAQGADEARIMARMPALLEANKTETLAQVIALRDKGVLRAR